MHRPPGTGRHPDPALAVAQYRRRAEHYDLELIAFEPVRRDAIAALDVDEGAMVIDVGCGTGLSFEPLKDRIGARGRIVGIDPSPEMLAQARRRMQRHHWSGIALVQATAHDAPLHGHADAALFHFTHDVLQDAAALDHILAHLKPGAHVVAAGLQWGPAWSVPVNLFVLGAALYSVTCLAGLQQPWRLLAARLRDVQVRTPGLGGFYIASGRL
jgi:demethylmenaquinone methyltransferase/2-methoxy-6-polyprenyl-1,4-benzoquinol methylase